MATDQLLTSGMINSMGKFSPQNGQKSSLIPKEEISEYEPNKYDRYNPMTPEGSVFHYLGNDGPANVHTEQDTQKLYQELDSSTENNFNPQNTETQTCFERIDKEIDVRKENISNRHIGG